MNTINNLPHLPTEIIDKINKMAYDMKAAENRELNRAVRFNTCMKWIEYVREDYESEGYKTFHEYLVCEEIVNNTGMWNYYDEGMEYYEGIE
tara:strand:- start:500 stop:775 length:276 start_codon:yes stop_codon:yes gene_type:complete